MPRRRREGLAVCLVVGAAGMVVLEAVVADLDDYWVWIGRAFWHPLLVEMVALTLVVVACWVGFRSRWLAAVTSQVTVMISLPVLLVTWALGSMDGVSEPAERFPAPGGRWSAVVDHDGVHIMEDGSHIWIQTNEGLRSRRWLAACFDADDPEDGVYAFTWITPQRAEIETFGGDIHELEVDARTGKPLARLDVGPAATDICGDY